MEGVFGADFDIDIKQTKTDVKKLIKKVSGESKK